MNARPSPAIPPPARELVIHALRGGELHNTLTTAALELDGFMSVDGVWYQIVGAVTDPARDGANVWYLTLARTVGSC